MPGLGTSFGRGGATTALQDLQNADAILIMGSNMAENHPVGFQWVIEARERCGKVIHVDPRFSRTSAMSDIWVPLRAGSDIVLLGAIVKYILDNEKDFREYILHYTNAAVILREDFKDTEDLDGLFSGWDPCKKTYDTKTWAYEGAPVKEPGQDDTAGGGHGKDRGGEKSDENVYHQDFSLQHPRCVYQVLKRHFSRYTPELVEKLCGVPPEVFFKLADAFCEASGPEKTGAICYAVGWTQHSDGTQVIRTAAILQLLLGNIGRPGGGILALAAMLQFKARRTFPRSTTFFPATCRCHF